MFFYIELGLICMVDAVTKENTKAQSTQQYVQAKLNAFCAGKRELALCAGKRETQSVQNRSTTSHSVQAKRSLNMNVLIICTDVHMITHMNKCFGHHWGQIPSLWGRLGAASSVFQGACSGNHSSHGCFYCAEKQRFNYE